mmetsp:Transcript_11244/g.16405  ORF Transcript_11244/g.16405 Transcript_11244/m.16405 type:complete len:214 (-) Transcript_11244:297-938(-)|eukprot:CAMPEP_0197235830 /NCGR_PEP_ID=MMETSP1429-20130617/3163_1 /TAXON_ID=49237 /ORGANISM="Chaetoceros  sp., Strain UNC1202" /LENGTH=213 /DNA_ID=CAMNT_0042694527 /DNA_START=299 /DNA_END=940 /DNA_ORIENTATION=+
MKERIAESKSTELNPSNSMDHVDQEIKNICPLNGLPDILLLQCPPLIVLTVTPTSQRKFQNEHLAGLGKQDRRLSRNHPHILITLHDSFNPGKGQIVVILEVLFGLGDSSSQFSHLAELIGPESVEGVGKFFKKCRRGGAGDCVIVDNAGGKGCDGRRCRSCAKYTQGTTDARFCNGHGTVDASCCCTGGVGESCNFESGILCSSVLFAEFGV